jgi:cephalosporin hydroxylase
MQTIEEVKQHVEHLKSAPPYEIHEHLETLQRLAGDCDTIAEFGVATGTSTWAFLSTEPKIMRSYDIIKYNELTLLFETAKTMNWDWQFIIQDTGAPEFHIEQSDLLFIDSMHTGDHCAIELRQNSPYVSKYIILHDTVKYGEWGQGPPIGDATPGVRGLNSAIAEFLAEHPEWREKERYTNNHGLLVLERC